MTRDGGGAYTAPKKDDIICEQFHVCLFDAIYNICFASKLSVEGGKGGRLTLAMFHQGYTILCYKKINFQKS